LAQNINPMSQDELDEITQERFNKIKELGLSSLMKESVVSDEQIEEEDDIESLEEKEDIIDKVIEDMVES
jgi:hypothetical protein